MLLSYLKKHAARGAAGVGWRIVENLGFAGAAVKEVFQTKTK